MLCACKYSVVAIHTIVGSSSDFPLLEQQDMCPVSQSGDCTERCSKGSCSKGQMCCFSGCGHVCTPIDPVPYYQAPEFCTDTCAYVKSRQSTFLWGAYIPQCDQNGTFSPVQVNKLLFVHAAALLCVCLFVCLCVCVCVCECGVSVCVQVSPSTGESWCVDTQTGRPISGLFAMGQEPQCY